MADNSNLTVNNSFFANIANGTGGVGILFSVSPAAPSTLIFTGLGSNGYTFDNVQTGVYGLGNISIQSSKFRNLERGVFLTGNTGPYNVNISENSFEDILDHSIFADQISPISRLDIKANAFNDNNNYDLLGLQFPRSGIHLRSFIPGPQNSWIFKNTFLNSPKTVSNTFDYRGVLIRNLHGSLIEINQFTDNFGSTVESFEGINLFNASTRIWSNNFTGAGNWGVHPSAAVTVQESPACWLSCNNADQTKFGWEFQGMNCDGASLEGNNLNAHDVGLLMRFDAIIGNQENRHNRWIGTGSNVEAQFEGRDPVNLSDVNFVSLSRFRIHNLNMTTDFWPAPRLIGSNPDPNLWYTVGQPANFLCIASEGGEETLAPSTTEADAHVMDGTYQPIKGYDAGFWEAKLRLYSRLSEHPELRPSGSVEADWYATQQNTTVSSLGNAYRSILSLSLYTAEEKINLENAAIAQQSAAQALTDKDAQIAANLDNPEALDQLLVERQQLEMVMADGIAAYENLLGSMRNTRLSAAQQILGQLNVISTTNAYEMDFKTVCRILLETYLSESGVSEANKEALSSIAHQCRYKGGLAVLQARASLVDEWGWSAYDNCPDAPEERGSNDTLETFMSLYPNPAKDAVLLDVGNTVITGRATLRDCSGRTIQEWNLDGQQQIWLRWNGQIPEGLYLIEVASDQKTPQVFKLTVLRN